MSTEEVVALDVWARSLATVGASALIGLGDVTQQVFDEARDYYRARDPA